MQALPILEPHLHAELMALGLGARETRIGTLERMGETELRWVNNLARSEGELARVKATAMEKAPAASEPKKRKRAAGKKKPRKRVGRNARGRDADEDSAEETESDDNDGADGSDGEEGPSTRGEAPRTRGRGRQEKEAGETTQTSAEGTAATTNTTTRGRQETEAGETTQTSAEGTAATANTTTAAVEGVKVPKWAKEARSTFLEGQVGNEPAWKECVELWWALEASTKFASPVGVFLIKSSDVVEKLNDKVKGFRTDGRPEEIHTWIKYA
jgi:hypothetical protein